jgi:hypothetical protein
MLADGHSEEEIVATTLVLLSLGTALLGVCLVVVGKAGLADAYVSCRVPLRSIYLPQTLDASHPFSFAQYCV